MSDELLNIFKEEASGYIKGLNSGLLKLELSKGEERETLKYHDLIERFRNLHTGTDLSDRAVLS